MPRAPRRGSRRKKTDAATAGRPVAVRRSADDRTPASGNRARGAVEWTLLRNDERIRWSRVMSAQTRIATGYYDREDVREFLVDTVLEELARH